MYNACKIAGNQIKQHKTILIQRAEPAPSLMKTANGGKNKAKKLVKLVFEVNVKMAPADQPSQTPGIH